MTRRQRFLDPDELQRRSRKWFDDKRESIYRNNKCKEEGCEEMRQLGSSRCAGHAKKS